MTTDKQYTIANPQDYEQYIHEGYTGHYNHGSSYGISFPDNIELKAENDNMPPFANMINAINDYYQNIAPVTLKQLDNESQKNMDDYLGNRSKRYHAEYEISKINEKTRANMVKGGAIASGLYVITSAVSKFVFNTDIIDATGFVDNAGLSEHSGLAAFAGVIGAGIGAVVSKISYGAELAKHKKIKKDADKEWRENSKRFMDGQKEHLTITYQKDENKKLFEKQERAQKVVEKLKMQVQMS